MADRPAGGTNRYALTFEGLRVAVFDTKVRARTLHPLLEGTALQHPHNSVAP